MQVRGKHPLSVPLDNGGQRKSVSQIEKPANRYVTKILTDHLFLSRVDSYSTRTVFWTLGVRFRSPSR